MTQEGHGGESGILVDHVPLWNLFTKIDALLILAGGAIVAVGLHLAGIPLD